MRPSLVNTSGYQAQTIEKVERLLELLIEIEGHPYLSSRVRLHGGTALNVFHMGMPRLSVDADLTYIGQIAKSDYFAERPLLESAIVRLGESLGYRVTTAIDTEHSGRTYKLSYRYGQRQDLIKIDIIYLNRSPLLEVELATCNFSSPPTSITTLAFAELIAGKTKALFDRVAVRDLYDIFRISSGGFLDQIAIDDPNRYKLQHRVCLHYASLSQPFPCAVDGTIADKFLDRQGEVEHSLYPVLHIEDRPKLETMVRMAGLWIDEHVAPKDADEKEYLSRLEHDSDYAPELLFAAWPKTLASALLSPAAQWKTMNLRKR